MNLNKLQQASNGLGSDLDLELKQLEINKSGFLNSSPLFPNSSMANGSTKSRLIPKQLFPATPESSNQVILHFILFGVFKKTSVTNHQKKKNVRMWKAIPKLRALLQMFLNSIACIDSDLVIDLQRFFKQTKISTT